MCVWIRVLLQAHIPLSQLEKLMSEDVKPLQALHSGLQEQVLVKWASGCRCMQGNLQAMFLQAFNPLAHGVCCLQARDPIPQLKKIILEGNILTQDELKAIEKDVIAEVDAAVQFADESPKPVSFPARTLGFAVQRCHYQRRHHHGLLINCSYP